MYELGPGFKRHASTRRSASNGKGLMYKIISGMGKEE